MTGAAVEAERVTAPAKPRLPRVTVEVAEPPATNSAGELAEMVKSAATVIVTMVVWVSDPLVPVTAIV